MRSGRLLRVMLCMAALGMPGRPAAANPDPAGVTAVMRVGNHPGFGRVVFDLPSGVRAEPHVDQQRVTVVFEGAATPTPNPQAARNVAAVLARDNALVLLIAPHAELRIARPPGKLVLDFLDPKIGGPPLAPSRAKAAEAGAMERPGGPPSSPPSVEQSASPAAVAPPAAAGPDGVVDEARSAASPQLAAPGRASAHARGKPRAATSARAQPYPSASAPAAPRARGEATGRITAPGAQAPAGERTDAVALAPERPASPAISATLSSPGVGTAAPAALAVSGETARHADWPASDRAASQRSGDVGAEGGAARAAPDAGARPPDEPSARAAARVAVPREAAAEDQPAERPASTVSPRIGEPIALAAPTVAVSRETAPPPGDQPGERPASPVSARTGEPIGIAASHLDAGDDAAARMLLPFSPTTGAAAYRAGDFGVAVFDERKPIDLAPFHDDRRFGAAEVRLLTNATMLRIPLDPASVLRLSRTRAGWAIRIVSAARGDLAAIGQSVVDGTLRMAAKSAAGVIVVPDQASGATLLVGTQREAGQAVAHSRRMPAFALRPSWQGVVVEPVTDALTLRPVADGFVISADARALPLAAEDAETLTRLDAANFSRRYDFGSGSLVDLRRRMEQDVATAAASPAQARLHGRVGVAQAMVGLGLGAEAQAILQVATADEPRAADDPDVIGLAAIAATLAGRPQEAQGLDDKRLDGTDDIALWRAVRAACCTHEDGAAGVFAAQLPLVRSYPPPLRARLLPIALRSMARGGEQAAVLRVLTQPQQDEQLELARAMALEAAARAGGAPDAALAAYDHLARSEDRFVSSRAAPRAAELRLATGRFTPAQAADALERQFYAWRGDNREIALRMRVADLRGKSGNWRNANELLRETEQLWPDQAEPVRRLLRTLFADAIAHNAKSPLPPLEMVALIEENIDLLPPGDAGRQLAGELSDRLLALDLPRHARPVLEKLLTASPSPDAKAEIADRLAALLLREHDAAGALSVLASTDASDLPMALQERRALTRARAAAAQGDVSQAIATLAAFDTQSADDTRARILEQAKDWPAALAAVQRYAARIIPAQGPLDDIQAAAVLRLAAVATQAGDDGVLTRLRTDLAPRLPRGRIADLATILTGQRLHGISDLPIVAQEVALARRLPDTLQRWSPPVAAR